MTAPRTGYAFLDEVLERPGGALAFAHRGGALHPDLTGLENTLRAFQHAYDLGYRYLETDVHVTRDGVLLAFHDQVLDRVTTLTGSLAGMDHREVADARIGGREPIPAMADLLEAFPEARFNVDVKAERAVQPLADLVSATASWDRLCVGSFSGHRVAAFRRATGGRVATSAGPAGVAAIRFAPSPRVARALVGPVPVLQVPHRVGPLRVVTPGFVRRAHAAGLHVHVWTIDDPEEMRVLLDRGVDGLMTDRTEVLREVLAQRGQWREPA